jgi:hypothetical protein
MALALITNSVLDIGFGVAYWTINKTCTGIYNLGCYFFSNKDEDEDEDETTENTILMDEIGKLREEIKDLKESINS